MAVHGLNGHRQKTWTADNDVLWLRDLLPKRIPTARVFSWGYDANTHSNSSLSTQLIHDHARTLVGDLSLERILTKTEKRPIIFVAHSLGGIVVKSVSLNSNTWSLYLFESLLRKALFIGTHSFDLVTYYTLERT